MQLNPYVDSLNQALSNAAATGAPEVQEAADRLARGVEPAVRLTLMEMASDIAAEVTSQLESDIVDVRFRGGSPEIVVERVSEPVAPPAPAPPPPPPPGEDDGGISRISLRLPESLKSQVDDAAAAEGVSANAWLVRAVQAALQPSSSIDISGPGGRVRIGRSISGWVR